MMTENFQKEAAAPVDEATKAIIEAAQAAAARGEVFTQQQADSDLKKGYDEWLDSQKVALPA